LPLVVDLTACSHALPAGQWVLCSAIRGGQDDDAFCATTGLLRAGKQAMICLECAIDAAASMAARPAIGTCAYCGAGICLDHARWIPLAPPPIGPAHPPRNGKRRFICTTCGVPALGAGA
jgi:hypothetical protein